MILNTLSLGHIKMNFCAIARAEIIYSRYFINVVIVFNSCSDLS